MYTLIKSWIRNRVKKGSLLWITLKHFDIPVRVLFFLFTGKIGLIYRAYFNKAFNFKKFDSGIIRKLKDTLPFNEEGCLFDKAGDPINRTQINFIASIIKQIKPNRILETGTHTAMFCYMAYLCNSSVSVDTFGNLPESQKAVDILNQKYGKYIQCYLGDSRQTLSDFSPRYQIDFAWVDGGHSFEVCLSDLINCARLRIPVIAVDDYKLMADVRKAVDEFVKKNDYLIANISNVVDSRGIILLIKLKTHPY